ncbi:MAG: hypothetical protein IKB86_07420, partial [Clostridia bacterium]|nr:hypothetical protein [Clostridia bacterium]
MRKQTDLDEIKRTAITLLHTDIYETPSEEEMSASISYNFLKWLLFLMLVAFIATTVFLWMFQTQIANNNADNLLRLNITDVKADIKDATNDHMLEIVRNISAE